MSTSKVPPDKPLSPDICIKILSGNNKNAEKRYENNLGENTFDLRECPHSMSSEEKTGNAKTILTLSTLKIKTT